MREQRRSFGQCPKGSPALVVGFNQLSRHPQSPCSVWPQCRKQFDASVGVVIDLEAARFAIGLLIHAVEELRQVDIDPDIASLGHIPLPLGDGDTSQLHRGLPAVPAQRLVHRGGH